MENYRIRKMREFEVVQRISDGHFSAEDFLKKWNKLNKEKIKLSLFLTEEEECIKRYGRPDAEGYMSFVLFTHFIIWLDDSLFTYSLCLAHEDDEESIGFQRCWASADGINLDTMTDKEEPVIALRREKIMHTYMVKDNNSGFIKIGRTTNVDKRFKGKSIVSYILPFYNIYYK